MKLWFESSNGNRREIAEVQDFNDVFKEIYKFIDKCNESRPKDKQLRSTILVFMKKMD